MTYAQIKSHSEVLRVRTSAYKPGEDTAHNSLFQNSSTENSQGGILWALVTHTPIPELIAVVPGPRHICEANTTQNTGTDSGRREALGENGGAVRRSMNAYRCAKPVDLRYTGAIGPNRAPDPGLGQ